MLSKEINFEVYKKYQGNNKAILRSQQRFKSELHNVFTEKVNKIVGTATDGENKNTRWGHLISILCGNSMQITIDMTSKNEKRL